MPTILDLARTDPDAARERLLSALTEVNGNRTRALPILGVGETSIRWLILALALGPEIERRWPGSSRGGGVRSAEHAAAIGRARKAAWDAAKTPTKKGVSRNRHAPSK